VPSFIGIVWLLFHWQKFKNEWEWAEQLPSLIVASLATAPFAWSFDYIVLLPAIIEVASWISRQGVPSRESSVIIVYVVIMTLYLLLFFVSPNDFWRFWLGPAFVVAYVIFQKQMTIESPSALDSSTSGDRPAIS